MFVHSSQAFKHVFTSPSSVSPDEFGSDDEDQDQLGNDSDVDDSGPRFKRQRLMDVANGHGQTRSHVAALLDMKAVQLRAIAYIAVQVRHFALFLATHLSYLLQ